MTKPKARRIGWSLFLAVCSDGTYYCEMALDIAKRLREINILGQGGRWFNRGEKRTPITVVYKETRLGFKEAFAKLRYMREMNRAMKNRLVKTGKWPIGGSLRRYIEQKPVDKI